MLLSVHPEVAAELEAAVDWYESRRVGLGDELAQDVFDVFELILERPMAWRSWPGLARVRVFPLDRFPFLIAFCVDDESVVILAVAHAKRRPGYWKDRE